MTTPAEGSDPTVPVPPAPEPTPEEAAAQQAAAEAATAAAALNDQIRALAAEIAKQTLMDFDPATIRKGTVASVQSTAVPPTLTVTISGDTLEIPGIRYLDSYAPEASDVVLIIKQGTDLLALGEIAGQFSETGFVDVPLAAGFSQGGNGNGNFQVRRVWDNGEFKVQMRGSVSRSSGTVISSGLDAKYRPTSATRRTIICARDANGSNVVKIDVGNDGTITMVGGTTAPGSGGAGDTGSTTPAENGHEHTGTTSVTTPNDSSHTHGSHEDVIPAVNAGDSSHNHGTHADGGGHNTSTHNHGNHNHSGTTNVETPANVTHNHGSHEHVIAAVYHTHGSHDHTIGNHTHGVTDPIWISFNGGAEYFL